jgi:hypothetical protein
MDFRAVGTSDVDWASRYRGQPGARTRDGGKVVVQTPVMPCRVSLAGAGMFRIDMALQPTALHSSFGEWVADIEDAAAEAPELREWRAGKTRSTSIYRNGMRLMAFSDTMAFDGEGKLSFNLLDATSCACLVELQGCWSTETRWGLRWKVVQVKFSTDPVTAYPSAQSGRVDGTQANNPGPEKTVHAFAFLDDD